MPIVPGTPGQPLATLHQRLSVKRVSLLNRPVLSELQIEASISCHRRVFHGDQVQQSCELLRRRGKSVDGRCECRCQKYFTAWIQKRLSVSTEAGTEVATALSSLWAQYVFTTKLL